MKNMRIRNALRIADMRYWQLAEALGVSEMTLTRRMRNEMPDEEQDRIVALIEEFARKGGNKNE